MSLRRTSRPKRIGTSERVSAPPAITTSAAPQAIASTADWIATFDEAQAAVTVKAGHDGGSPHERAASRARFVVRGSARTVPRMTRSTAAGSMR